MRVVACFILIVLLTVHAGTNKITVTTQDFMEVSCSEDVTLRCGIDKNVSKVLYHWTDGSKILCHQTSAVTDRIHCSYTESEREITLNIRQVTPSDNGIYNCIVQTGSGHGMNRTRLRVSDCIYQAKSNESKQPTNEACVSGSGWISALTSLILVLRLC